MLNFSLSPYNDQFAYKEERGGDAVEEEEEPRSSSGPAWRRRTRSAATAGISRARCGGAQGSPGRGAE